MISAISNWLSCLDRFDALMSPKTIASIWTRFHYGLRDMGNALGNDQMYVGLLMHRMIVLFLNSVLVEEIRSAGFSAGISYNNPLTSDQIFISNLERRSDVDVDTPYFDALFACPVWGAFLRKTDSSRGNPVWDCYAEHLFDAGVVGETQYLFGLVFDFQLGRSVESQQRFRNLYWILNSVPAVNVAAKKLKSSGQDSIEDEEIEEELVEPDDDDSTFDDDDEY